MTLRSIRSSTLALHSDEADAPGQAAPVAIATRLRGEILRGVIPGGERIRQDAVATRFKVSQNTAREAFKLLEADGLLCSEPRRGMSVASLSAAEAWEITELRSLLEVQALSWALPTMTPSLMDAAAAVLDELDTAKTVDDTVALNATFHRLLYASADRHRTLAMIETLRLSFERYLRLTWQETSHLDQSQREHREILAACRQHDRRKAAALLRQHIRGTGQLLVERFGEPAPQPPSDEISD